MVLTSQADFDSKYNKKELLAKKGQVSIHVTENVKTSVLAILKEIECEDKIHAEKVIAETKILSTLQYPNICQVLDFQNLWNDKEQSLTVAVIMAYYPEVQLSTFLNTQRNVIKEPVHDMLVKKWSAQLLETIQFLHSKQIIHRNLKPSSLFLGENNSLIIGNFGIGKDIGSNIIRATDSITCSEDIWSSPETISKGIYVGQSDVWSAGCILLAVLTCSTHDTDQIVDTLMALTTDTENFSLDAVLQTITEIYSSDISSIVGIMLRTEISERPLPKEILNLQFLKECLKMLEMASGDYKMDSKAITVPTAGGICGVIKFIREHLWSEEVVKDALTWIVGRLETDGTLNITKDDVKILLKTMTIWLINVDICTAVCRILLDTSEQDTHKRFSKRIFSQIAMTVVRSMQNHSKNTKLNLLALQTLVICLNEKNLLEFCQHGGVECILNVIKQFSDNSDILNQGFHCLWIACINEDCTMTASSLGALNLIVEGMKKFPSDSDVQKQAASCITALTEDPQTIGKASDLECIGQLILALECHNIKSDVVASILPALSCLAIVDEGLALEVIECPSPLQSDIVLHGINSVLSLYEVYKDNATLVMGIVRVVFEVTRHRDIFLSAKSDYSQKVLDEIKRRYSRNMDIFKLCRQIVADFQSTE